jgi:hypothetical protein
VINDSIKLSISFAILLTLAAALTAWSLFQTDYANGWDSYFYIIQAKSWIETGSMHTHRWSLFYPVLITACYLSKDYEFAYKITAIIAGGLFLFGILRVSWIINRSHLTLLLFGAIVILSPHYYYFVSQYAKNMLALGLFAVAVSYWFSQHRITAVIFIILAAFTHKLLLVLGLLFLTTDLVRFLGQRHSLKTLFTGITALLLLMVGFLFIFPDQLERQTAWLSNQPAWYVLKFIEDFDNLTSPWKWELILASVIPLLLLPIYKFNKRATSLLILWFICQFPFLIWDKDGVSYRLFMVLPFIGYLVLASLKLNKDFIQIIIAIVVCFEIGVASYKCYNPTIHDPNYSSYKVLSKQLTKQKEFKNAKLLIAHKALAEYLTYSTGKDVLPWVPEYEVENEKLFRIVTDFGSKEYDYYARKIGISKSLKLTPNYFLVKESDWQQVYNEIEANEPDLFEYLNTWKNPHLIRPAFLRK